MLQIDTIVLGALDTNTYIVRPAGSSRCIVIDPADDAERILSFAQKNNLTIEAICLTHGHFDHVRAVGPLAATTGCRVYLNPVEAEMPARLTAGPLFYTDAYPPEGQLEVAGMTLRLLHTPGHTEGSMCLLVEDALFSGDTLFAGSCGRTDLPSGSRKSMRASLARLRELEGDLSIYPGHGEATTLAREKQSNPYLM